MISNMELEKWGKSSRMEKPQSAEVVSNQTEVAKAIIELTEFNHQEVELLYQKIRVREKDQPHQVPGKLARMKILFPNHPENWRPKEYKQYWKVEGQPFGDQIPLLLMGARNEEERFPITERDNQEAIKSWKATIAEDGMMNEFTGMYEWSVVAVRRALRAEMTSDAGEHPKIDPAMWQFWINRSQKLLEEGYREDQPFRMDDFLTLASYMSLLRKRPEFENMPAANYNLNKFLPIVKKWHAFKDEVLQEGHLHGYGFDWAIEWPIHLRIMLDPQVELTPEGQLILDPSKNVLNNEILIDPTPIKKRRSFRRDEY